MPPDHTDTLQQMNMLFGSYKAEWLNESIYDHFTEPTYFPDLTTARPCFLLGGRGTGKTTTLLGLSYHGQFAFHKHDPASIPSWSYYGIFYRVNINRVAAFRWSVGGENNSASRQLARYVEEQSDRYLKKFGVWMMYRRDRYGRGGDHIPFLERGFTAVRITESDEDYTHQHQNFRTENGVFYGDTPEFVDFAYTANVVRVNLVALANLAAAPAKPKNVTIVTGRLTNDTDLKWDANTDTDIAGYEVVWRDTTAAEWTSGINVGNVTAYTAKSMSKDNYFLGVRAVDKLGNKSPVVYPRPGR